MIYGNHVESSGARFIKVDKLTKNSKKLERGSLDYMVAYTPKIYDAFDLAGKDPFRILKPRRLRHMKTAFYVKIHQRTKL